MMMDKNYISWMLKKTQVLNKNTISYLVTDDCDNTNISL